MTGSIVSVGFFCVMSNQETNRALTVAVANGESYSFLGISSEFPHTKKLNQSPQ